MMVIGEVSFSLEQMQQAMDIALADELKEQQKQKLVRRFAINGELTAEHNGQYIYSFSLDDPWDPEDDTPITIRFVSAPIQDIKGCIITSLGTIIKVATEKPLPTEGLQKVLLIDDSTQLLERLRESLKSNNEGTTLLGSKKFWTHAV